MAPERVPLSTLLSWVLVAFTIEGDNEFEVRMPHRTTDGRRAGGRPRGPWLVSWPTWATILQYVDGTGATVADIERRGFLASSVLRGRNPGVVRWGYVTIADRVVRTTPAGERAAAVWRDLPAVIEDRWRERYGAGPVGALRDAAAAIVGRIDIELPDYLPVNAAHGGRLVIDARPPGAPVPDAAPLPTLLARLLVRFTLDYERAVPDSLVMAANPLRVLEATDVRRAELPRRTGVARETLAVMLGDLERRGHLVTGHVGRVRTVRLSPTGRAARDRYRPTVDAVEGEWADAFGRTAVRRLRAALEALVGSPELDRSPLRAALAAPEGCWRAARPEPDVLPHHPVVSHRGGYPDGS